MFGSIRKLISSKKPATRKNLRPRLELEALERRNLMSASPVALNWTAQPGTTPWS